MQQVGYLMKCWAIEKEELDNNGAWKWEMAGLLHDADWDQWPDLHCKKIIEELEHRNIDPEIIHAIASHGHIHFGVEPVTKMDKMLYAFDELSGLIHAYSLVHDDMPCMDNDVLRRGKPTVHVKFGEAVALLTGDTLQALAFEVLTPDNSQIPETLQAKLCALLARAAGHNGMAGGQAIDLRSVGISLDEHQLSQMHKLKTGALLEASVIAGAMCAGVNQKDLERLKIFGSSLGLAFQVIDDVLDVTADSSVLGKTSGKDAQSGKPTYVSLMGLEAAKHKADVLIMQANQALLSSDLSQSDALAAIALKVVNRKY